MRWTLKIILFSAIFGLASGSGAYFRWFNEVSASNAARLASLKSAIGVRVQAPKPIPKPATIVFVGDIMLSRGIELYMRKNADFRYPFLLSADFLRSADLAFGNLEGPVSGRGADQGGPYSFRADPRAIEGLVFSGFDALSLSNNHILDWGKEAFVDTLDLLEANSIASVGAGENYRDANEPVMLRAGQAKVAFFAHTNLYPRSLEATESRSGISSFEPEIIKKKIFEARGRADIVVVSLHWGEEYAKSPNAFQKQFARELIDAGADLIIGHHPHVIQKYERYKNGWIFYSLGNFVFDQGFSEETMRGLMVKVLLRDRKIDEVEPIEVRMNVTFQPEIVSK